MSPDPAVHRARERQFIEHVERLLGDERLRVDTTKGRRPVTAFSQHKMKADKSVELKREMTDAGRPDRELEAKMPLGESVEVELSQSKMLLFKEPVGRLKCLCLSPSRALLKDAPIEPVSKSDIERALGPTPPGAATIPTTVVVLSTSGFTFEAHELADRRADRTLILVEPNDAGGYSVYGPVETKSLNDLFDPEAEEQKRKRVRETIESSSGELSGSGVATDRLVAATQLPLQLIEAELKDYAKHNPGLVAKRLEGRIVLFREGSVPAASSGPGRAASGGGSDMPMIDRIKSLFARKGENEKKISFLSERRALLGQQRDRAYDDIATLEKKDEAMRRLFRETNADVAKRRITSQLVQLRKDLDRRHQLISVLNQQIEVVSTHLHTLELVQQGQTAQLPDSDEMAMDAAKAEEMLATLEANHELAQSVGGVTTTGMSAEEQAMFEELQREAAGGAPATPQRAPTVQSSRPAPAPPSPTRSEPQRSEPEAG